SFINRKHGREPIDYDHPWMESILSETYGIMVYQEQVMQIAQKLANYSLGEGDVLRRAMGKKDAAEMARQREKFKAGALQNNISEETATQIFDKMEKFASYGFNKSHAAAYGYLSYVTAFFKSNYPGEWMAALMTCDRHDISKLSKFIREAVTMGLKVLPPDVNEAGVLFQATPEGIRFALSGIKGVGEGVVEAILEEREKRGRFLSLYDFIKRLDVKKVGKKACESLIEAGCFDFTGWSRDSLLISVDPIYEAVSRDQKEKASGFMNFFDLMGEKQEEKFEKPPKVIAPSTLESRLLKEKELLGFFLTGHPMDKYKEILGRLSCVPFSKVEELPHDSVVRTAFIIESIQIRFSSKSQKKFAILMVSDGFQSHELPIWPEMYEEKSSLLRENQLIYAILHIDKKEEALKLSAKWLHDLTFADESMIQESDLAFDKAKMQIQRFNQAKAQQKDRPEKPKTEVKAEKMEPVKIELDVAKVRLSHILRFKELFEANRGSTPIDLVFLSGKEVKAIITLDGKWGINLSDDLKAKIKKFDSCRRID
ncbi:MAG: DNA polymerase III subunit alpha, partial [Parachlamydiaceae bacterium]